MAISLFCQVPAMGFLVVLLTLSGCDKGSHSEDGAVQPPQKVTNVSVRTIQIEDLRETFTLPGTLEAWEDLTLSAEVAGPVRWIGPHEGMTVRKGEPILRIDPDTMEAGLARDQADFELQRRQLERMEQLVGQKFVSQQEYDQTLQAFEVASAELRRSRVALEKSTLRAPVDGIVDCWHVDCGEYVAEGTPVASVVQVDRLKVLVEIPEKDVHFLRTGDRVQITPAVISGFALPERSGEIIHLAFKADPLTRTYLAKVAVDNPARDLRPGMIVRVGITRMQFPGAIAVPLFSVVDRDGEKVVYVEESGVARMRPVTLGPVIGERVVVAGGLRDGDRLIVQGQQLLTDGAPVAEQEVLR
jgi:membrane fusion protein, multidrug efflux system